MLFSYSSAFGRCLHGQTLQIQVYFKMSSLCHFVLNLIIHTNACSLQQSSLHHNWKVTNRAVSVVQKKKNNKKKKSSQPVPATISRNRQVKYLKPIPNVTSRVNLIFFAKV